jgi:hypothetical protein
MPTQLNEMNPTELLISSALLLDRAEQLPHDDPQKHRLLQAARQLLDRVSQLIRFHAICFLRPQGCFAFSSSPARLCIGRARLLEPASSS